MDKNKIIQAATKYVQRGQLDKAIAEYQKARRADPKDVRILLKIGELQQKKGDKDQAANTLLDVAKSYAADGFFLKAVAVYKQIVKLDPSRVSVNVELAELYQQLGLNSDAMSQLEVVANHYEREGNAGEALNTLRRMVDLDPDNVTSRIKLGELFAQQGKTADALRELRVSAEHLKSYNRMDDYLRVAERICLLAPEDVGLSLELAGLFLNRRDARRALARLQVCFNANPRDPATLELLARAFQELGQVPKAVAVYKELARIHRDAGAGDQERQAWRKVLELSSDDAEAIESFSRGPSAGSVVPAGGSARPAAVSAAGSAGHAGPPGGSQAGARSGAGQVGSAGAGVSRGAAQSGSAPPARAEGAGGAAAAPVARPAAAPANKASEKAAASEESKGAGGSEQLPKLLTEVDVYIKYGLFEKANAHLQVVRSLAPHSLDGLERLIQLHAAQENAAAHQAAMVEMLRACLAQGQLERGRSFLHTLIDVAPDHPELQELLGAYAGGDGDGEAVAAPQAEASVILDIDEVEPDEPDEPEAILEEAGPQNEIGVEELKARAAVEETAGPSFLDLPDEDEELFAATTGDDEPMFHTDPGGGEADESASLVSEDEGSAAAEMLDDELLLGGELADDDTLLRSLPPNDDEILAKPEELALDVALLAPTPPEDPLSLSVVDDPLLIGEELAEDEAEVFSVGTSVEDSFGPVDGPVLGESTAAWKDAEEARKAEVEFLLASASDDEVVEDELIESELGFDASGPATLGEKSEIEVELTEGQFFLGNGYLAEAEDRFRSVLRKDPGNVVALRLLREAETRGRRGTMGDAEPVAEEELTPTPVDAEEEAEALDLDRTVVQMPSAAVLAELGVASRDPAEDLAEKTVVAETLVAAAAAKEAASAAETTAAEETAAKEAAAREAAALEAAAAEAAAVEAASATTIAATTPGPGDDEPFDLGIELANELVAINSDPDPVQEFQYSVDDVLAEFKKGVSQTVSAEDTETHYDLGIAYKEMGLLSDAIAEFEIARKGSTGQRKEVDCLTMAGMCEALLGEHEKAIASFLRALGLSAVTPESAMALHFEIGLSHEAMGNREEALSHYGKVARIDPSYRKVEQAIQKLEAAAAIPPQTSRPQEGMGKV